MKWYAAGKGRMSQRLELWAFSGCKPGMPGGKGRGFVYAENKKNDEHLLASDSDTDLDGGICS